MKTETIALTLTEQQRDWLISVVRDELGDRDDWDADRGGVGATG